MPMIGESPWPFLLTPRQHLQLARLRASLPRIANSEVKAAGLGWLISSPGHVAYDIHLFLASQIFS
jgi:hypothetical protein